MPDVDDAAAQDHPLRVVLTAVGSALDDCERVLSGEAVAGQPADDRPIRVADPATLRGHIAAVKDVAFSPDSATLASGSFDTTVRLWPTNPNQIQCQELNGYPKPNISPVLQAAPC